ncbi:hypothetical protein C0Q70_15658 [Pomacea canaliculata]|uniref:Uncharacterized protein n=1 Tax=Pomacea canaliculata TaxID=400727 RepID=A0A2T7NVG3_POMCA|nr:hypothetical protein C0Q70_15658 [Pomacea canaliculata]
MEAQADQDAPCPAWGAFKRELLDMTCRVKTITNAVSVATVHVTGGARCTCTVRSNGEVPLKKAAEELSANVGKLVEEILRHAVDAQSRLPGTAPMKAGTAQQYMSFQSRKRQYPHWKILRRVSHTGCSSDSSDYLELAEPLVCVSTWKDVFRHDSLFLGKRRPTTYTCQSRRKPLA